MITLKNTYENRKDEIKKFLQLLLFFQNKKIIIEEDEISFDDFFYSGNECMELSYQELINIMKSNLCLMLYNIIEFTVAGLIDCIYDEIRMNELSYIDVNEYIRKLWRKTILKAVRDPKSNHETFLKKNEEIVNDIIERKVLDIHSRQTLPAGNLDGFKIKETFEEHGILMRGINNFRPDILVNMKEKRNNLSHGSVSFAEAVRDDTITDIQEKAGIIFSFLEELITITQNYIENEGYRLYI